MSIEADGPLLKLLQLVSPSLPIGAYSYSQGMEQAIDAGWIVDAESAEAWLRHVMHSAQAGVDVPLLLRLYRAWESKDMRGVRYWNQYTFAMRETAELRRQEAHVGKSLAKLLAGLGMEAAVWREGEEGGLLANFALAAVQWRIASRAAIMGYVWSWLENQVLAAVKAVPLGQLAGQKIMLRLAEDIPALVALGCGRRDDEIASACPALAIASSRHEIQYTRLFQS